uniref:BTB domain-containing protein n=1 Tax=Steinernema glaseri TaxID=37863 RepID=A0A1I8APW7_9BILA
MTNIGKIEGTLEKTGTSDEVEIGGAKWSFSRDRGYYGELFVLRCAVGDGTSVLWSCTAKGRLTAWQHIHAKHSVVWSHSFNSLNTADGYAQSKALQLPFRVSAPFILLDFEAEIEVIKLQVIDLSAPPNKSIKSVEDGACFEVDGKKLWLSKKVLSVHSPFFEALFSHDFEENATGCYALKEVDIDDFKMFLSVLYNMNIPVKSLEQSLEGLLRLGDMWQCDLVLRFCHDILSRPDSTFLPLRTKIELCDRHGFCPLLATIIEEAHLGELKVLVKSGFCAQLSSFTTDVIMQRFANSA